MPRHSRVLDYGCGYGRTVAELAEAGYADVTGIDFSESLINRGKAEHPALDLRAYAGGPLPFEDGSFDAALLLAVLTCIPETKHQAETLLELKRVLKPGGMLYINDFLLNRDKRNLDRYKLGQDKYGLYGIFDLPDGAVMRHHHRDYMEALLWDFEMVFFRTAIYETMNGHTSRGFYCMVRMP